MSDNLSLKQKERIIYLKRLCRLYMRFMDVKWKDVNIIIEDGDVHVIWYQILRIADDKGVISKVPNTSHKEFPIKDLNKQIREYKKKVNGAYKNRNKKEEA